MKLPILSRRLFLSILFVATAALCWPGSAMASAESSLVLPNLKSQTFWGLNGHTLLTLGIGIALLGIVFGLVIYMQLKQLPVHQSMRDVSELIYETCKTYLLTQGKFI